MRAIVPLFVSLIYIIIIDFYTFKGLMFLIGRKRSVITRWLVPIVFFTTSIFFILTQIWLFTRPTVISGPGQYSVIFTIIGLFVLLYVPKSVFCLFHIFEDFIWITMIVIHKIKDRIKSNPRRIFSHSRKHGISILSKAGGLVSITLFFAITYGLVFGRFNYKVKSEIVYFEDLPSAFDGKKIVQISDLHIGSLGNHQKKINKAVNTINSLEADFVFFTGDLMNTYASELDDWLDVISEIKAKIGKYAVMGNHDYGDYVNWETDSLRNANIEQLKQFHYNAGFKVLDNISERIIIANQEIVIAGVENWGKPPFPQYGDIKKALEGTNNDFIILLSHDPSHWVEEVIPATDVNITFSGHTHGFQFGIDTKWLKWSPIQYKYPHWAGLYSENEQYLYVNRGLGYVAFPGRVGVRPEITLVELRVKK